MAATPALSIDRQDDCWTVALDRERSANALNAQIVDELLDVVAQAGARGVRVLVLRGNGRNFSAGFDFGGFEDQSEADLLLRFVRIEALLQAVSRSPCLTVGLAHGRNFGAGADIFAACQWRIAEPGATFRMPGLAFGLVLGTRRLAALVGAEKARDILESLATFNAEQALACGFVRQLTAQAQWPDIVQEARRVAGVLPPASRARLYRTLDATPDALADASLADLVRSAAEPGLKARMQAYRDESQRRA
ncbi:MAG TPA: enoyl-CoA hydratase/isomerase family protein [Burkholderiaceae bacterium]|nr:enoyl-CoA hydratase/isomerase family protein [Burkholderiaceae bacterium]